MSGQLTILQKSLQPHHDESPSRIGVNLKGLIEVSSTYKINVSKFYPDDLRSGQSGFVWKFGLWKLPIDPE